MKECRNCHTMNTDDARYCKHCRFALDWPDAPKPVELTDEETDEIFPPPLPPARLDVSLEPEELRPAGSETARVKVRVQNRGGDEVDVALRVSGTLAPLSTLDPVTLRLSGGEEAIALLEIGPLSNAEARAEYEVAAVPLTPHVEPVHARGVLGPEEPPPPPPKRWVWAVVVVVAIAALVVFVVLPDGGGVNGRVRMIRSNANVRAGPSFFSERVGGLPAGAEVEVECQATGPGEGGQPIIWDRLGGGEFEGRFVAHGLIELEGKPPGC